MGHEIRRLKQYLRCFALLSFVAIVAEPCRGQDVSDVAQVIVPFVEKHCVKCHGGEKPTAGLSMPTVRDSKAILKERKLWDTMLHLIESGEMPPPEQGQPSADEKSALAKSIRAIYAKADTGKPDPGRSLIRRLTRVEYGTSVRDLLHLDLDFKPEYELPSDVVTHGFENDAEALTVSSFLLDRYLDVAESVAKRAIRVELPKREILDSTFELNPGVGRGADAPVNSVLEKLKALAESSPKDALVRYRLARVHAAAYGFKSETITVMPGKEDEGVWLTGSMLGIGLNSLHLPTQVAVDDAPAKVKAANEHLEQATARYREVLQLEPESLPARLGLAWCLLQAGDKTTAKAGLREVIAAAWIKEKEFGPADWKGTSTVMEGFHHLSPLLDKKEDAAEIAALVERITQIRKTAERSPWRQYRLLESGENNKAFTGPFFVTPPQPGGGNSQVLKYSATDDYLLRVTLFVEQASEPVRVAVFVGGPGLPDYSTPEEREQILGGLGHPSYQSIKILTVAEATSRSIDAPQKIETLISRRGRTGELGILGIGLIKPKSDASPVRLHFKLEAEGPLTPISHEHILACSTDKSQAEQTREIIGRLLPRAFRRPVTKDEIEAVAKFADRAVADGLKWEAAIQQSLVAMLCSPKFLYRPELDDRPNSTGPHPIGEFELASRLSYFLWSSLPDEELLELAREKKLAANLEVQVRRMLKDPRSKALVDNFFLKWLRLDSLTKHQIDAKMFPHVDSGLREAMLKESRFFLHAILREDRSLLELIDADYTYLNQPLARHYRIADTLGNPQGTKGEKQGAPIPSDHFVRVQLQGHARGGILTQASVLMVTSPPTRTSPVIRGAWVLENILGTAPPPPPPNVPGLDQKDTKATTVRERLEQHRANVVCASCHSKIDPLGFAFENYDADGAFRGGKDVSGMLPDGRKINGLGDLKTILLEGKEKFARHVAEKMLTYALGRGVEYYDKRAVDRIVSEAAKDDYRLSRLVIAITQSDPLRLRRGKDQE